MKISIADGWQAQTWFELLQGPDGDRLEGVTQENETFFKATFRGPDLSVPQSQRWQTAQQAEAAFWRTWRANVLYSHISLADFWQEVIDKTGGPLGAGRTLDIGCGPVSVLNFHRHQDMQAIGLDPLGGVYAAENLIEAKQGWEPIPIVICPAEKLPFADAALDQLICFNVLDHVAGAPDVLDEMFRILKPGGEARVYVHTFAPWIKRLLFFDTPHVYHWDHEEFQRLLIKAGFELEHAYKEPKTFDLPTGTWARIKHFPYWVATKVAFTSYFKIRKNHG